MRSACALLVAAAAGLASGVDSSALAAGACSFTPAGYTADQVFYDLTYFSNLKATSIINDDRNYGDPFNYQIAFCQNVNPYQLQDQTDCSATRSMISQTNCSAPVARPAMVFQYYQSGAGPTPSPSPVPPAPEATGDSVDDAAARAAAVAAGVAGAETGRIVRGALRDTIVADARRALAGDARQRAAPSPAPVHEEEAMSALVNPLTDGLYAAPTCGSDRCWRVAGDFANPANFIISNVSNRGPSGTDTHHLASGVTVSMAGGDTCYDAGAGAGTGTSGLFGRRMDVHLICSPQFDALDSDALVVEIATCRYEVVLHSVHACPTQCLQDAATGGTDLCGVAGNPNAPAVAGPASPRGVCNFDTSISKARCFCFEGWSGPYCTMAGDLGSPKPTGHPEQVVGGLFGGLVGGLIIGGGIFYYVVYVRVASANPGASFAAAPAPATSGTGGIRSMFGGSSGAYAPPTPEGGAIPGIDDAGAAYEASGGDDDDNPML